ncbi:hypothetical protein ABI59_06815 [Acidobacteria bacterium Mor1]|nr:hypothetical protein ABI59_06815 [Acidobacteria bacterium Mor1]
MQRPLTLSGLAICLIVAGWTGSFAADCDQPILDTLAQRQISCLAEYGTADRARRLTSDTCLDGMGILAQVCAQRHGNEALGMPEDFEAGKLVMLHREGTLSTLMETDEHLETIRELNQPAGNYLLVLVNGARDEDRFVGRVRGSISLNGSPLVDTETLEQAATPLVVPLELHGKDQLAFSLEPAADSVSPGWLQMLLLEDTE